MSDVAKVASWLRGAHAETVITGAGVSAESGLPISRSADGLWRSFRPEEPATPQAFKRNPQLIWDEYRRRSRISDAAPTKGHGLPTCASCGALLRADVGLHGPSGSVLPEIEAAS